MDFRRLIQWMPMPSRSPKVQGQGRRGARSDGHQRLNLSTTSCPTQTVLQKVVSTTNLHQKDTYSKEYESHISLLASLPSLHGRSSPEVLHPDLVCWARTLHPPKEEDQEPSCANIVDHLARLYSPSSPERAPGLLKAVEPLPRSRLEEQRGLRQHPHPMDQSVHTIFKESDLILNLLQTSRII